MLKKCQNSNQFRPISTATAFETVQSCQVEEQPVEERRATCPIAGGTRAISYLMAILREIVLEIPKMIQLTR